MKRRDLLKNIALTSVGVATAATGLNASPTQESDLEAREQLKTLLGSLLSTCTKHPMKTLRNSNMKTLGK